MTAPSSIDPSRFLHEQLGSASPDLLRHMLTTFMNTLMSAEADAVCGAPYGESSPERTNVRNGYRHRKFDTRAGTLSRRYADEVAERAAALGVPPDGRAATVADGSTLPTFPAGWIEDREVIRHIFEVVDGVVRRLRPRIDEADKTDLVTQDLLIEILRELEKVRSMWQAQSIDEGEQAAG